MTYIYGERSFEYFLSITRIKDPEIINTLVRDDDDPEIVVASDKCFNSWEGYQLLKKYMLDGRDRIFIFFCRECLEPDLTVFDYATTWNRKHIYSGRMIHNVPAIWNDRTDSLRINDLTREEAVKLLRDNKGFCNFIYSHAADARDKFYHMLSGYKKIDSLGPYLHNTDTETSRNAPDWYDLSIEMKHGYKFSIAMENASCSGYTSEKLITSLHAHTVPIYWGDPDVAELVNPKAFINCNDYSSFEEVIKRVKEIDNDDDLWLDIVTQPWQTEEQQKLTLNIMQKYNQFWRDVFLQDIKHAKRRPEGSLPDHYFANFWNVKKPPSLFIRAVRKLKRIARKMITKAPL